MGKKLTVGDTIFDFNYQTPWQKNLRFLADFAEPQAI